MTDDPPSKSQRKRDMHELQDLGAALVELSEQQLADVELPERLRDAVMDARAITRFEARRRQLQYIGKLMRTVDPAPIRAKIASWQVASRAHTSRLHLLEEWRERLIAEPDSIDAFIAQFPDADRRRLQELVANIGRERESGRPPKNFRALFQFLDAAIASTGGAASGEAREPADRDGG